MELTPSMPEGITPIGFVQNSPELQQLLTYVITNARAGELMAVDNYTEMVQLFEQTDDKIATVQQANEECKHILLLEKLAGVVGVSIDETYVHEQWVGLRENFHEAVGRRELATCLIIQDLMVESLAIAMYETFASEANGVTETSRIARQLLDDELEHLDMGLGRISTLLAEDADTVHDGLRWAHHRCMPLLFGMVKDSCDFLCREKSLVCETVAMGPIAIDLKMLEMAALDRYVSMLYEAGFDPAVVNPLVASMAAYDPSVREALEVTGVSAQGCDPSTGCC
ncbi:MAG: long-chain fatty aldehyde decarbonylase [Myxococcales bacterium]|nr:long-chain fatty aldehyde decarbonylase [Myxococcales bacterium]